MSKKQFQEMEEVFILEEGIELDKDSNVEDLASERDEKAGSATCYVEEDAANAKTRLVQQKKNCNKNIALYHCPKCAYSSSRRYSVFRHMKSHSGNCPFVCKYCDHKFKTVLGWQNHLNTHKGHKPHICTYCQRPFTTSGQLIRHVRYKHTLEKPHKCNECEYATVELSKLRRHQRCHTGERPYQCPHCTYAAPDPFKLKRHLRTHTGEKPYKCNDCLSCFTQANSLKAHQHKHNVAAGPMFNCALCPTKCRRKSELRVHVRNMHSTQKQYKCICCGKLYSDRYAYKVHIKSHNGEKCFKCHSCTFTTATVSYLRSHLLKHTGEKPFQCDKCKKAFRQKQLLRRHQNLNHNPKYVPPTPREKCHQCNKCPQKFVNKGNLNRHLAAHKSKKSLALPHAQVEEKTNVTPTEVEEQVTAQSLNCENIQMDDDEDTTPLIQLLNKLKAKKLLQESSTGIDNCFGFASNEDSGEETAQAGFRCDKPAAQ